MEFHLTQEEQWLLDQIHEFAVNEVAPLAAELDEQERFPSEAFKRLGEMGMMGVCYPKEVGGGGHSYLAYIAMVEELAKYCATTSIMFAAHHSLGAYALSVLGTPEQKENYLVPLMKGEKLGAFGCTEPGAGTDLGGGQCTRAEDKGDHWLLNGSKIFITNGYYADIYFISAVTDPSQRSRGISAFLVEKGTPGFTFGKKEKKMGIRGSATYELVFQDCKIPKENLLGEQGERLQNGTCHSGRWTHQRRCPGGRYRPRRHRLLQKVCDGTQHERTTDLQIPVHPIPACGYANQSGRRPASCLARGAGEAGRRTLWRICRNGKALCL